MTLTPPCMAIEGWATPSATSCCAQDRTSAELTPSRRAMCEMLSGPESERGASSISMMCSDRVRGMWIAFFAGMTETVGRGRLADPSLHRTADAAPATDQLEGGLAETQAGCIVGVSGVRADLA